MSKTIKVKYMGNQGAEDLFKNGETGRVYVRLPLDLKNGVVRWTSGSKWSGGYEADCYLKHDVTVQVVNREGTVLFEEICQTDEWYSGTCARKVGKFSYEIVDDIKKRQTELLHLQSYDEWKKWLLEDMDAHGYKGYRDNWLFCEAKEGEPEVIDRAVFYDVTVRIIKTEMTHRISKKKWFCIEIESSRDDGPCDICGYLFGDNMYTAKRGRKKINPEKFSEISENTLDSVGR